MPETGVGHSAVCGRDARAPRRCVPLCCCVRVGRPRTQAVRTFVLLHAGGRSRTQAVRTFVLLLASATPALPGGALSSVECLGEMSNVLHSRAPLPLIPPTPFSHKGRRGSLGVLMPETGDGTQGRAKTSTPVSR